MPEPLPEIAGVRGLSGEREVAPLHPSSSWDDGAARGDSHCPDCERATTRDDSWPEPFDVMCSRCRWRRSCAHDAIEQMVESLKTVDETGVLFKPVPLAWPQRRKEVTS